MVLSSPFSEVNLKCINWSFLYITTKWELHGFNKTNKDGDVRRGNKDFECCHFPVPFDVSPAHASYIFLISPLLPALMV